jgi:hypothetical protein
MDVVSACPLRVASLAWQARTSTWVLTVVCKATYRLEQGVSPLAAEQEHPNDDDNHWDDDPRKSVYAPSDLAPFKTRSEVLLVGNAFAPGGAPVASLSARLRVGEMDKTIAVYGDRAWTMDGRLREPATFARMPLRYERAAGGPDTENPVGMRPDAANAYGEVALPNLWPPDRAPQHRGELVPAIAFAPIAPSWPARRDRLGPLARSFSVRDLSRAALPLDVDPVYFSSAPRDQQLAEIRADESFLLENLHPRFPRLGTKLPGIAPRAYVERRGTAPQEVTLRGDTLWIDTDRSIVTVTFRGQVPLSAAAEPGRVIVGMERSGQRLAWNDLVQQLGSHPGQPQAAPRAGRPAPSQGDVDEAESLSDDDVRDAGESSVIPPPDAEGDAVSTLFLMGAPDAAQTMPFALAPELGTADPLRKAEQAGAAIRNQDLPAGWSPPSPYSGAAPPSPMTPPSLMTPSPMSPPAQMPPPSPDMAPTTPPPPMLVRPDMEDAAAAPRRPEPLKEIAVAPPLAMATDVGRDAARLGVLGMSDAAAGAGRAIQLEEDAAPREAEERAPRARPRPAEILKLLWFEPRVVPRLHRHPEWRILLAEMELRQLDEPEEDEPSSDDTKARRAVFEVLSRGLPSPADSLRNALNDAVDERGAFEPPLVLLTGELEFPFDEVEALKAAITVLTPLGPTEKKLKDALDAAGDFLKAPGADQFGRLAEGLTDRLREAFAQARRTLPADYVDSHMERALLRQRAYSMKTLYGKRWIRALLRGAGPGTAAPPVYLPEALKDELPAYKRVRLKALGEVDLQEDQEEAAGWVVKISALARVISGL